MQGKLLLTAWLSILAVAAEEEPCEDGAMFPGIPIAEHHPVQQYGLVPSPMEEPCSTTSTCTDETPTTVSKQIYVATVPSSIGSFTPGSVTFTAPEPTSLTSVVLYAGPPTTASIVSPSASIPASASTAIMTPVVSVDVPTTRYQTDSTTAPDIPVSSTTTWEPYYTSMTDGSYLASVPNSLASSMPVNSTAGVPYTFLAVPDTTTAYYPVPTETTTAGETTTYYSPPDTTTVDSPVPVNSTSVSTSCTSTEVPDSTTAWTAPADVTTPTTVAAAEPTGPVSATTLYGTVTISEQVTVYVTVPGDCAAAWTTPTGAQLYVASSVPAMASASMNSSNNTASYTLIGALPTQSANVFTSSASHGFTFAGQIVIPVSLLLITLAMA